LIDINLGGPLVDAGNIGTLHEPGIVIRTAEGRLVQITGLSRLETSTLAKRLHSPLVLRIWSPGLPTEDNIEAILWQLRALTSEQRGDFLSSFRNDWCISCGGSLPCNCERDE
jgi:hypothetical protein